jgi:hypothetical protein
MCAKISLIKTFNHKWPELQLCTLHNKWDTELGDFMPSARKSHNKYKSCAIKYSPMVGLWFRWHAILKWIWQLHDGKVPNTRNLQRAALCENIENPLKITQQDVEAHLHRHLQE